MLYAAPRGARYMHRTTKFLAFSVFSIIPLLLKSAYKRWLPPLTIKPAAYSVCLVLIETSGDGN